MKQCVWLIGICMGVVMLSAVAETGTVPATLLLWQEQETGIAPYPSRMLVTEHYLRSDEGQDDGDFLLFDRPSRKIYSVSHEQRMILVIEAEKMSDTTGAPPIKELLQPDPEAPKIDGQQASHFQLYSGDQECLQATVVPGLMPDVVAAMREMQTVLAARQYRDLGKTPDAYQTPCFLANYVYAIDRHLQAGFPILELRQDGRQRALLDYRNAQPVASELFTVPQGYTEERMQ